VSTLLAGACGSGDDRADPTATSGAVHDATCDWPMLGRSPARTFAHDGGCETAIGPGTVARLGQLWFTRTRDVVTASPAVASGVAYVGDWSGRFYALDLETGAERWLFDAPVHENVYSGQIVSSAAVGEADGEQRVFFASGKTLYAAAASDGAIRWEHELGAPGDGDDPTEIQSSPVVADGVVIVGWDAHDEPGRAAGVLALDAASGEERWVFDTDEGRPASGCVGVWSSPSVDVERGLVFFGTANCPSAPQNWRPLSEAIVALDLQTGEKRWAFQPRDASNNDFDFAGAPNLFEIDGRAVVGLGGKDGRYYALDRATGAEIWRHAGQDPEVRPGFSFGGFIGATAVADGIVAGGLADNNHCPCLLGIDAATGERRWEQPAASATYGSSATAGGVLFAGGTDFTFRAIDLASGEVLWSQTMVGAVSGGAAIAGDTVVVGSGIREPGVAAAGTEAGVYAFRIGDTVVTTTTAASGNTLPPGTTAPPETPIDPDLPARPLCVASPCDPGFGIKAPPEGTTPSVRIWLTPDPFRIEVRGDGFGPPEGWLRPGSTAAAKGAVAYAVFVNDDALRGVLLCVLDDAFDCVNTTVPDAATGEYNRISILAIENSTDLPSPAEGFDRLATTVALDGPVTLQGG
jgi:polyvinyl alcohol dehydrogenase (cytochrome)